MTQEEFDSTRFTAKMTAIYRGSEYGISTVNFYERLLGLLPFGSDDEGDLIWVRCESMELVQ